MKKMLSNRYLSTLLLLLAFSGSSLMANYAFKKKVKDVNWTKEQLEQFELDCKAEWETGSVLGPVHLSKGNEEQLIEIFQYVHPQDYVYSTWRNHYHALLHGIS